MERDPPPTRARDGAWSGLGAGLERAPWDVGQEVENTVEWAGAISAIAPPMSGGERAWPPPQQQQWESGDDEHFSSSEDSPASWSGDSHLGDDRSTSSGWSTPPSADDGLPDLGGIFSLEQPQADPPPVTAAAAAAAAALPRREGEGEGGAALGASLAPPVGLGGGLGGEHEAAMPPAAAGGAQRVPPSRGGRGREAQMKTEPSAKRPRGPPGDPEVQARESMEAAEGWARHMAEQAMSERQARGEQPHPTSQISSSRIVPRVVYELLNVDRNNPCQGKRPDFINDQDIGRIFVERLEGLPNNTRKDRRQRGLQSWSQGDFQWFKQVPGVSYGQDGKGEVWVKATYGQVKHPKNKKKKGKQQAASAAGGSSAAAAAAPEDAERDKTLSYSMYELFWMNNGVKGGAAAAPKEFIKKEAVKAIEQSDWVQGTLYHVKNRNNSTEIQDGQLAVTGLNKIKGAMTIELGARGDDRWMQFDDAEGNSQGSLSAAESGGVQLETTSGDFAEYHKRDPTEAPFEEGDLVGFGPKGLTRKTKGMRQLGVITRRPAVSGSRPDPAEIDQYDTVGFVGMVPVKLRGGKANASKLDWVVPSGFEDGTGVAVSGQPSAMVGRIDPLGLHADSEELWRHENRWCCDVRWRSGCGSLCSVFSKRKKWELVMIGLTNPPDTVKEGQGAEIASTMSTSFICAAATVLALLLLVANTPCFVCKCQALVLPHGTLRGDCIGERGSTCLYSGCDTGYKLLPSTIDEYDAGPSAEASEMISNFPPCDKALSLAAALGEDATDGWTCYRHGQRPDATTHQFPRRSPDGDMGWCVSGIDDAEEEGSPPKYCSLEPQACTVCTHPAVGSGWKACELSQASDGSDPVCKQPTAQWDAAEHQDYVDWVPLSKYITETSNPLLSSCWLPTEEEAERFGSPWPLHVRQDATDEHGDLLIPVTPRRYFAAEVCSLSHQNSGDSLPRGARAVRQLGVANKAAAGSAEPAPADDNVDPVETYGSTQCQAGSLLDHTAHYSGTPLHCVQVYCPAETVSLLTIKRCNKCYGKDTTVTFPRTGAATAGTHVNIGCPTGFIGNVSRTCGNDGSWSATEGTCTRQDCPTLQVPLSGQHPMPPEALQSCYSEDLAENADRCLQLLYHTLTFDEARAGTGRVTAQCPWPHYSGTMSATCSPNATSWSELAGACTPQFCAAEWKNISFCGNDGHICGLSNALAEGSERITATVRLRMPKQVLTASAAWPDGLGKGGKWSSLLPEPAHIGYVPTPWQIIPCCSTWSTTGSCIDEIGSFGWVLSKCKVANGPDDATFGERPEAVREVFNWTGINWDVARKPQAPFGRLGCKMLDESVRNVKLDHHDQGLPAAWRQDDNDPAEVMYRALRENLGDAVSTGTNGLWSLPLTGILSSVSVSMPVDTLRYQWRPVISARNTDHSIDKHASTSTLDARLPSGQEKQGAQRHAGGRAAAAFAHSTCQQMGFTRAALVTNCKALYKAAKEHRLRKLPHQDTAWWSSRSGSTKNLSATDLSQLDTPLLSQLCPDLMTKPTPGSPFPGNDIDPFGQFKSNAETAKCHRWLEVKSTSDSPGSANVDNGMATWLHNMALNRNHPANYSFAGHRNHGGDVMQGDQVTPPLPVAPSCSGHPKEKEDISRCFSDQMNSLWERPEDPSRGERPCSWKIIIGCSNDPSQPERSAEPAAGDEGAADGTWVIGDQNGGVSTNWNSPKIFTDYGGPYNCSTGRDAMQEVTAATEAQWRKGSLVAGPGFVEDYFTIRELCWGKLLDYRVE